MSRSLWGETFGCLGAELERKRFGWNFKQELDEEEERVDEVGVDTRICSITLRGHWVGSAIIFRRVQASRDRE